MKNTSNPVLENIHNRRSCRSYLPEPVPQDILSTIIEAGRAAPSGSNSQTTHFLVITSPQVLTEVKELVVRELASMTEAPSMYKNLRNAIQRAKQGFYDCLYGAPALIVTANKKGYGNAMADCSCALENMMLAAFSLEIGSCWINQLRWLNEQAGVREYMEKLGLGADEDICGSLALGYPVQAASAPLERSGNPVTYI